MGGVYEAALLLRERKLRVLSVFLSGYVITLVVAASVFRWLFRHISPASLAFCVISAFLVGLLGSSWREVARWDAGGASK
jgi:uncharacterized membrane protein